MGVRGKYLLKEKMGSLKSKLLKTALLSHVGINPILNQLRSFSVCQSWCLGGR